MQKLYEKGDESGVLAKNVESIKQRLSVLDNATSVSEFDNFPTFKLHKLKGNRKHIYAITVRANWRITFTFKDGDAVIFNLEDYH